MRRAFEAAWLAGGRGSLRGSETFQQIDLRPLHQRYQGDGRRNRPYHPVMMLTLLVYAYATGVFSRARSARSTRTSPSACSPAATVPTFAPSIAFEQNISRSSRSCSSRSRLAKRTGLLKLGGARRHQSESQRLETQGHRLGEEEERLAAEIQQLIEQNFDLYSWREHSQNRGDGCEEERPFQ